jgi:hypothetical protein
MIRPNAQFLSAGCGFWREPLISAFGAQTPLRQLYDRLEPGPAPTSMSGTTAVALCGRALRRLRTAASPKRSPGKHTIGF